ncbi:ABC transporter permease [Parapusillimonas granuli]|uniref:ABC transporter permease n=1 Tax=Parapusillimonas granuli TaxID=380911 RepID=A0A853FSV5_9BURK|nr:ABC transporter permease [Parapusillimonas granuli]MBB5214608.1 NitT/TauT family transport system permease protein [Parapusillimonas granuli]MEB2398144.1 ABC transporter permease [Alcaligenaceae bacterium]NYT48984.1 ABC transporter permease [Parapusillimonas granuli]
MSTPMLRAPQRTSRAWSAVGVLILLAGWQAAAMLLGPLLMATPLQALRALGGMLGRDDFWFHAGQSLGRIAIGVGLGCSVGFILGVLAGHYARLRGLLEPLRWLLMAIPPVVVVVLAMLWFGLGSPMVIFITVLMMAPGMYVNTVKGMLLVDRQLIEMAHVYRYGPWLRLRHLYLPALAAPLTAALLIATCGGVRLVVMAEVLGAESGAGYAIANARSTFDSGELYAWVILTLLLVALLEFMLLQPIQRRLTQWQEPSTN